AVSVGLIRIIVVDLSSLGLRRGHRYPPWQSRLSGVLIVSPVLLIVTAAILIETGRPIFFRQNRRGFGGREFKIWKFRSMTVQENGP
ncbi:sugar transferase, partial [Mycobacterium tuberculosis]|nr:sugar transferase [Mycobacterium tuberculosis]